MNDHVLLNISTVTGKWFRKYVYNFNLTGVKSMRCCWQTCMQFHTVVITSTDYFAIFTFEDGSVYHLISRSNKLPRSQKC